MILYRESLILIVHAACMISARLISGAPGEPLIPDEQASGDHQDITHSDTSRHSEILADVFPGPFVPTTFVIPYHR